MSVIDNHITYLERAADRFVKNVECDIYARKISKHIDDFLKKKNLVVLNHEDSWRIGSLYDGGKAVAPYENEMERIDIKD